MLKSASIFFWCSAIFGEMRPSTVPSQSPGFKQSVKQEYASPKRSAESAVPLLKRSRNIGSVKASLLYPRNSDSVFIISQENEKRQDENPAFREKKRMRRFLLPRCVLCAILYTITRKRGGGNEENTQLWDQAVRR